MKIEIWEVDKTAMPICLHVGGFAHTVTIAPKYGRREKVSVNIWHLRPLCDLAKKTKDNQHVITVQIWGLCHKILSIHYISRGSEEFETTLMSTTYAAT